MTEQAKTQLAYKIIYKDEGSVAFLVQAGGREAPLVDITFTPEQAAALGRAMLAASVVCKAGPPKPAPGALIHDCHFPVERWDVGFSNVNKQPILALTVTGGAQMVFQFTHDGARAAGAALGKEGAAKD